MTIDNKDRSKPQPAPLILKAAALALIAILGFAPLTFIILTREQKPIANERNTIADEVKSESDYRAATEQADAHGAMVELACFLYRKKDGDRADVRRLLERAAALNNLEAMVYLAKFLRSGSGGPAEPALAEALLRKAYTALKAGQYYSPSRDMIRGPWEYVENAERDPSPDPWHALQKWLTDDADCGQAQLSWALELGIDPQAELDTYWANEKTPPPPPKFDKAPPPFVPLPPLPLTVDPPVFRKLPYYEPVQ